MAAPLDVLGEGPAPRPPLDFLSRRRKGRASVELFPATLTGAKTALVPWGVVARPLAAAAGMGGVLLSATVLLRLPRERNSLGAPVPIEDLVASVGVTSADRGLLEDTDAEEPAERHKDFSLVTLARRVFLSLLATLFDFPFALGGRAATEETSQLRPSESGRRFSDFEEEEIAIANPVSSRMRSRS